MVKLKILNGSMAGTTIALTESPARIGSDESCQICIPEPGVSGVHATMLHEESGWSVEDAGGSFGTLLNGNDLQKEPVTNGDTLTLGWIRLRLQEESSPFEHDPDDAEPTMYGHAPVLPVEQSQEIQLDESDLDILEAGDTIPPTSMASLGLESLEAEGEDTTQLAGTQQMTQMYLQEIERLRELQEQQALEVHHWREEASRTQEELALREDELGQLQTQMAVLEDECHSVQTRNAMFEDEVQQLQTELALARSQTGASSAPPAHNGLQQQVESLQHTLNVYYEDNERLQGDKERLELQLSAYEEAAEANEQLLEERDKLESMVQVVQRENDHLKVKLREFWQVLHQHGLLPGK